MKDEIILAPIRGITDLVYRNAFTEVFGGLDSAMAPYIVTKESGDINVSQLSELDVSRNSLDIIPQILTNKADQFTFLAHKLKDMGHTKANLNMGCPYPMVANRKKGSGLLPHPEIVEELLEKICSNSPIELTVKLRLGRECSDEILKIVPIINRLGIKDVTVHPRLGKQLYKGSVDLDTFSEVLDQLDVTPCYNGDIYSIEDFTNLKDRFPSITRWMIGRGVLQDPSLPLQIKGQQLSKDETLLKIKSMHALLADGYLNRPNGHSNFILKMKEHWSYLSNTFENPQKVFKKIKKAKSIEHYNDAVALIFKGL